MGLPLRQVLMKSRQSISLLEELCSPASVEGRYLILSDDLCCLLPEICHPQILDTSIGPVVEAQEVT